MVGKAAIIAPSSAIALAVGAAVVTTGGGLFAKYVIHAPTMEEPGMKIGEIVDRGPVTVQAYALEADRSAIAVGQKVRLRFDARPDLKLEATIATISGAPAAKMEMGAGRYFTVTIPLDASADIGLLPSSSVRSW